jgi:hypothetical protein
VSKSGVSPFTDGVSGAATNLAGCGKRGPF